MGSAWIFVPDIVEVSIEDGGTNNHDDEPDSVEFLIVHMICAYMLYREVALKDASSVTYTLPVVVSNTAGSKKEVTLNEKWYVVFGTKTVVGIVKTSHRYKLQNQGTDGCEGIFLATSANKLVVVRSKETGGPASAESVKSSSVPSAALRKKLPMMTQAVTTRGRFVTICSNIKTT